MKARIVGKRQADVVPAEVPPPKDDWVQVKVHASAMCTEYKAWLAGARQEVIGHEGAGEVTAVAQPGRVQVGDRVVVMPQFPCGTCALCRSGERLLLNREMVFQCTGPEIVNMVVVVSHCWSSVAPVMSAAQKKFE